MSGTEETTFTIRTEVEWRAINSAVRLEMLVFVIMAGPCGIRELAELMDRAADGLYHHLRQLLSAGLVREAGTRKVGTQVETLYEAVARDITVDKNLRQPRVRERLVSLFRTILQQAQRTVEAAINEQTAVLEGDGANFHLKWQASWLDDRQLKKLMRLQKEIVEIMHAGRKRRKGRQYAVLTYLSPVTPKQRRFEN